LRIKHAVLILFLLVSSSLFAEEAEPAILLRGPVPHLGIEFLDTNAIPSYYGEYQYDGGRVRIYFTSENIVLSEEWVVLDCSLSGVFEHSKDDGRIDLVYMDRRDWTAFFSFEAGTDDVCGFIESYRKRQNYFLNIARDKSGFSFPAILEF